MSAQDSNTGFAPVLSPDIAKDLAIYEEDMQILAEVREKLQDLAKSIKNSGNVMYEVIQVFSLYQDVQAGQIRSLSAVDDLESTIRGKLSAAQSDWNTMGTDPSKGDAAAQDMVNQIQQIEAFIQYEQGQKDPIMDSASLQNLQSAIDSVKTNFGSQWGNASAMNSEVQGWVADTNKGQNVPQMKNIQDGFQTLNQSVSELSSTTNSQLQFVENQYKQGLGEENAAMQAYQKLNSNTIRHFTSS